VIFPADVTVNSQNQRNNTKSDFNKSICVTCNSMVKKSLGTDFKANNCDVLQRVGLITTRRKNEGCEEDTGLKQGTRCLPLNV
jgi:hypothetical protein